MVWCPVTIWWGDGTNRRIDASPGTPVHGVSVDAALRLGYGILTTQICMSDGRRFPDWSVTDTAVFGRLAPEMSM